MNIAIVGGGIGGLATAVGLQKIGINVHIYEQAKSFMPIGAGIGIGSNVMKSLHHLGVSELITDSTMPLHVQYFLNGQFQIMNMIDFSLLKKQFGEETVTIERAHLHESLFRVLDPSTIHFNKSVQSFNQTNNDVTIYFQDGTSETYDYVIAADGIHSVFRQTIMPKSKPRYAGYTCWRGITQNIGDVERHVSSELWSKRGRFGWAPLANGNVYWFACINSKANDEYFRSLNKYGVANQFKHLSPIIKRLIQETKPNYFLHHDIYDIKPLNSFVFDRVCLIGDAAHATTPNMGQGAGQAIEDAYELIKAIKNTSSVEDAFKQYNTKRLKKANKVIQLSRQIGQIAQWDKSLFVLLRNTLFPFIPSSLLFWRLTFLFDE